MNKCGFQLVGQKKLDDIGVMANLYRHQKTGARVLSLHTEDKNKVFGITFRTPPQNSTGVAHILEHSVLCGSKKYPLKEPFVELLKSSLQTFLNAMTYPDKTCYPVASTNEKDFYNLIDVYLDAVFYPLLHPYTFYQEGWHYELENPEGELSIKGVVYNEMKGAYSSPDSVLFELSQQSLFPNHVYGFDSGGHPKEIVKLTYEEFLSFHKNYYHPANSWIYFYGNDPEEKRLQCIAKYLDKFSSLKIDSSIPLQPNLNLNFKVIKQFYSASSSDDKSMFTLNWLFANDFSPEEKIALFVLEEFLIGLPGSPLRKNLIESGLGEDLAGVGLESELRQAYFSIGLKGIKEEDISKAEEIILSTLKDLSYSIDKNLLEAALNSVEFKFRENNTGAYPQGLSIMLKSLTFWLYDKDPLALFEYDKIFQNIRKKLKEDYFEKLINALFLQNSHTTKVILIPKLGLFEQQNLEEKEELRKLKNNFTKEKILEIVNLTKALQSFQQRQDDPQDLAKIPTLKLKDLDSNVETIPCVLKQLNCTSCFTHHLNTGKIVYLDLGFNLQGLRDRELILAGMLGKLLLEMGTKKRDYVDLNTDISRYTGGIYPLVLVDKHINGKPLAYFWLRTKVLESNLDKLRDILTEILTEYDFGSSKRLEEILREQKSGFEQSFIPSGHSFVLRRLKSCFNLSGVIEEYLNGIEHYFGIKHILTELKNCPEKILEDFKKIAQKVICTNRLVVNLTVETQYEARAFDIVKQITTDLNVGNITKWPNFSLLENNQGLQVSAQVNYVGKGYKFDTEFLGSSLVISRLLRTGYLWEKVRVIGGAYGAFCVMDIFQGEVYFCSYRDPNHIATLNIFDNVSQELKSLVLTNSELEKLIIATIGELEKHKLPDAKGFESMLWELKGLDIKRRQKIKDQIFNTSLKDIKSFAQKFDFLKNQKIVVLGGENTLLKLKEASFIEEIIKLN